MIKCYKCRCYMDKYKIKDNVLDGNFYFLTGYHLINLK